MKYAEDHAFYVHKCFVHGFTLSVINHNCNLMNSNCFSPATGKIHSPAFRLRHPPQVLCFLLNTKVVLAKVHVAARLHRTSASVFFMPHEPLHVTLVGFFLWFHSISNLRGRRATCDP